MEEKNEIPTITISLSPRGETEIQTNMNIFQAIYALEVVKHKLTMSHIVQEEMMKQQEQQRQQSGIVAARPNLNIDPRQLR